MPEYNPTFDVLSEPMQLIIPAFALDLTIDATLEPEENELGEVVPIPKFPDASSNIRSVKVMAVPAVPEAALDQV